MPSVCCYAVGLLLYVAHHNTGSQRSSTHLTTADWHAASNTSRNTTAHIIVSMHDRARSFQALVQSHPHAPLHILPAVKQAPLQNKQQQCCLPSALNTTSFTAQKRPYLRTQSQHAAATQALLKHHAPAAATPCLHPQWTHQPHMHNTAYHRSCPSHHQGWAQA